MESKGARGQVSSWARVGRCTPTITHTPPPRAHRAHPHRVRHPALLGGQLQASCCCHAQQAITHLSRQGVGGVGVRASPHVWHVHASAQVGGAPTRPRAAARRGSRARCVLRATHCVPCARALRGTLMARSSSSTPSYTASSAGGVGGWHGVGGCVGGWVDGRVCGRVGGQVGVYARSPSGSAGASARTHARTHVRTHAYTCAHMHTS